MTVLIGTSGWMYRDWRERFYPKGVPQRLWLGHYAERFATVESNSAFYMLPKPETFKAWADRTPDDFVMAVKVNRYITHIRRLRDCAEPAARFLEHCRHLGSKLGPILLQLPPNLKANLDDLRATLDALGAARVAVEFRHSTWFTDETQKVLTERNVALCMADRNSQPISPTWRTADWTYLRLHQGRADPMPCYGRSALDAWAGRLTGGWSDLEAFVYFNNDPGGCALRDARTFAGSVRRAGLEPTRVPSETISVG
nr:DUF72 domain-containing protein [Actinomycetota bacterium]